MLGPVEPIDWLHQHVVEDIADGPDRWGAALKDEVLGQSDGTAARRGDILT